MIRPVSNVQPDLTLDDRLRSEIVMPDSGKTCVHRQKKQGMKAMRVQRQGAFLSFRIKRLPHRFLKVAKLKSDAQARVSNTDSG
jgi:hypothetical protein